MLTRILRTSLLLTVIVGCGGGDLPTHPTTPNVSPRVSPSFEPSVEGEYKLTVAASPSCSLPAQARQRTYTATVAERTPGFVTVTLSGAEFWHGYRGFEGARNDDVLQFDVGFRLEHGVIELIDGTKPLLYDGIARARIADRNIVGTFSGVMALYDKPQFSPFHERPSVGECVADDHGIEFAR